MAGTDGEEWSALISEVRAAPSPEESPAYNRLYTLAMRTGKAMLGAKFGRQLDDGDIEHLVSTKFAATSSEIVNASNPRGFFVTAIVREAIGVIRRSHTADKHAPELTRVGDMRARAQDEQARVDTIAMAACFETFSPRDQQILRAVGEGDDREAIARHFATSRANIDQIISRSRKRWAEWQ